MCGISGIFSFNDKDRSDRLKKIHSLIKHRGQDANGFIGRNNNLFSKNIYFAHRRLSILDLSDKANQPFIDKKNNNMIIYNGEIYNFRELREDLKKKNYKFKTNSDTEVILYLYNELGIDLINYLNGMFSFAIWDEKIKALFCVRDEFGVKPFYYKISDNSFEFSSESKALYQGEELNHSYIQSYFLGMYSPFNLSVFKNIQTLKPGHYLKIQDNEIKIHKYFSIEDNLKKRRKPNSNDIQKVKSLFDSSVKSQLISDRNIAVSLSSGNDSSAIFHSMYKNNINFSSISIGFENHNNYDLKNAIELSKKFGIENYNEIISNEESFNLISKSVEALSEPIADSSIVPTFKLSQISKSINAPVLLSGVGGDEVFMGYDRYKGNNNLFRYLLNKLPYTSRNFFSILCSQNNPVSYRIKNKFFDNFLSSGGSKKLFSIIKDANFKDYYDLFWKYFSEDNFKSLYGGYQFAYFDLISYLPNLLLNFYDQITMSHTIEGRVPFINRELIKFCSEFDYKYHADFKSQRKIFKKANLNQNNFPKKKFGFSGPIKNWIDFDYKKFKEQIMYSDLNLFFRKKDLEKIFYEFESKKIYYNEIYILYVFCVWKNSLNVN
tara:strand:- start:1353 stop:3173 length:1821 start_codon:yes stop_codon:yes gene_type:complete